MSRALIRRFVFCSAALAACVGLFAAQSAWAQAGAVVSPSSSTSPSTASSSATGAAIQGTPPPTTSHGTHVVTVAFDYDFRQTPACTAKITTHCVMQFIAYDISASAKNPTMLFPIPLPPQPTGLVKSITKAGPPLDFESGKHLIAVSAMSPDGSHSKRNLCTTWITIP
jgi:hypothetical protein